jgi:hypothetical protein
MCVNIDEKINYIKVFLFLFILNDMCTQDPSFIHWSNIILEFLTAYIASLIVIPCITKSQA